ncbi:M16 family metallopeptidase [Marinicella rhabdoformis]|uniref:M16 family metallopeptidase n=1 Tax=Marinicella rhabdoformis TaxID=2580566 RepID=UPI0012AECBF3|nr:pitrilysin family protein [Marinicella rhabdoformis]
MTFKKIILASALATAILATGPVMAKKSISQKGIVKHPSKLKFDDRELYFADAGKHQVKLTDGNVAYVVEDNKFPLVRITITSPIGEFILSEDAPATGDMAMTMLRDGGTKDLAPDALDERLDFLATSIRFNTNSVSSSASLDTLSDNLDESLDLMFDLLTETRFDTERLQINKDKALESMRRRNDDTRTIEPRVWAELIRGEEFYTNHMATESQVTAIDEAAMKKYVDQVFGSGQLLVAVSGAVERDVVIEKLNQQLARLPEMSVERNIPDNLMPKAPGLYGVNKDDVTQTRVTIGHPGTKRDNPDYYAIQVMNDILGGGGFTSRITKRVRSDEGLAYSAGSRYSAGRYFDGQFRAYFQSKNPSVAQATAIVLEEIEKIQNNPVSAKELQTAQEAQLTFLADLYSSPQGKANRFVTDDLNNEAADYWENYEQNIRAVTVEDVQRVAKKYLNKDQLRILLVGKLSEAEAGDGEHGTMESVTGLKMQRIALKEPLTLEPLN